MRAHRISNPHLLAQVADQQDVDLDTDAASCNHDLLSNNHQTKTGTKAPKDSHLLAQVADQQNVDLEDYFTLPPTFPL